MCIHNISRCGSIWVCAWFYSANRPQTTFNHCHHHLNLMEMGFYRTTCFQERFQLLTCVSQLTCVDQISFMFVKHHMDAMNSLICGFFAARWPYGDSRSRNCWTFAYSWILAATWSTCMCIEQGATVNRNIVVILWGIRQILESLYTCVLWRISCNGHVCGMCRSFSGCEYRKFSN